MGGITTGTLCQECPPQTPFVIVSWLCGWHGEGGCEGHCNWHTVPGVSSVNSLCCDGSPIMLTSVRALEATTDTLCRERSPLAL